ncbi:MAG: hypothetical protein MK137_02655 [Rickettsiales bacterium]|nr:hypothetical protein [Rickettsiales bacterium]
MTHTNIPTFRRTPSEMSLESLDYSVSSTGSQEMAQSLARSVSSSSLGSLSSTSSENSLQGASIPHTGTGYNFRLRESLTQRYAKLVTLPENRPGRSF